MQNERAFKGIKNKRYRFRLPESGTKSIKRLENLILIALIATDVAYNSLLNTKGKIYFIFNGK